MDNGIMEKLRQHEQLILDEFVKICDKHGLKYYLMWGTLLGAVRHQGFIPWDDDIDVCMTRKEYKQFLKIAPKELDSKFFLQTNKTDKYHPVSFAKIRLNNTAFYSENDNNHKRHHGIFIDIFPMDSRKRNASFFYKVKQKLFHKINQHICSYRQGQSTKSTWYLRIFPCSWLAAWRNKLSEGKGECYQLLSTHVFEADCFDPVIKLEFAGKKYSAPHNYDKILTTLYGDYMQLPPEDKRIAHLPSYISFDLKNEENKRSTN